MSDNTVNPNTNGSMGYSAAQEIGERETTAKFQRDELVRGWHEYEAKLPRMIPLVKFAAKTDMGQVRENNEDKFDFYEPEVPAILAARGSLYAVADGVGGALAGQIASELMLKQLIASYYDHPSPDLKVALQEAVFDANDKIYSLAQMIPERAGMGTTLTVAIFVEDQVVLAQVGDSRAYLVRDNMAHQITVDHSWVEEQVRAGVLSRNDAEMSPFRNVITRSIGAGPTVKPDIYVEPTRVGDTWVLCSDGLTGHVHEEEIARIVGKHSPSEAARQLIELANAHGGRDNITVFILSVRELLPIPSHASAMTAAMGEETLSSLPTPPNVPAHAMAEPAGTDAALSTPAHDGTAEKEDADSEGRPRGAWRKLFGR